MARFATSQAAKRRSVVSRAVASRGPSRRRFLQHAATATLATLTLSGTKASGRVQGANDTIRAAVAGIRGRGGAHINELAAVDGVTVTTLIDPDRRTHRSKIEQVQQKCGVAPRAVQDVREALDDDDLDLITIATPNHWHALMTIWACQAGKDVYVEKPCSHNVLEGRRMVEAAEKYGRIVQTGTQRRSIASWGRLTAAVRSGHYGRLLISRSFHYGRRGSIGFADPKQPPSELDFNIWLGPAPKQPYHENLVHYNWHWFWDTGNGEIGNNGVHWMDVARWAVADGSLPKTIYSVGGRYGYQDQAETPNTHLALYDFGSWRHLFECRGLPTKKHAPLEFYLEEGKIVDDRFYPKSGGDPEPLVDVDPAISPGGPFGNFIDCVRSRKADRLNAPAEEGHRSAALCHLGNISYRLGRNVPLGRSPAASNDERLLVEAFEETKEHLEENDVKLDEQTYRLGRRLQFDPQRERFVDCPEADALLTRDYRAPFGVPRDV
jgi:predicted dehydrogenase